MLKYMDYAYAVYREKSFTKAAEKLYISQPSLSLTIKKLEKDLGFPIFERSGKDLTLTTVGEKYIKAIEEIMQIKSSFENELDDLLKLDKGSITLGSTTFIASYILPDIVKKFTEQHPGININIGVEQSTVLYEKLEKGLYDIIIDNVVSKEAPYNCICIPLFHEEILIGVPSSLPVNKTISEYAVKEEIIKLNCDYSLLPRLNMKSLENEKFILLKPGNKMREIADKIFSEAKIAPEISQEFDLLMTSVNYSEHEFGICFLTDTVIKYGKKLNNLFFYLPDCKIENRDVYIIHKKNRYITAASKKFIEFLKERNDL